MNNRLAIFSLILVLNVTLSVSAQTLDLESANLQQKFMSGEWTPEKYQDKAADFRKLLKDMGGYPELGYNTETDNIEYEYILEVSPDKELIYNRINEWAAINFGSLDYVLHYSNLTTGKIILKGHFDVNYREDFNFFWTTFESINRKTCYQTYVFTIVNQKVKVNISNVRFDFTSLVYGPSGINTDNKSISVGEMYPITNSPSKSWKSNLDMLYQTKRYLSSFAERIQIYINNSEGDYEF
jgi:hypothetical protein